MAFSIERSLFGLLLAALPAVGFAAQVTDGAAPAGAAPAGAPVAKLLDRVVAGFDS